MRVLSHQEPWLDTGGPVGDLLIAIFGWVAQQERQRIGERVPAGQSRARAQGVHIGRNPHAVDVEEIRRPAADQGWRRIAPRYEDPYDHLSQEVEAYPKSLTTMGHAAPRLARVSTGGEEGAGT